MSTHNITVEGGSSVRLPTAGKYCDRDIVVTANMSVDGYVSSQSWSEDLIQSSIDTDGSIYNDGLGYKTGYRLNSAGEETISTTSAITGYIPYENGDVFRLKATNGLFQTPQYIYGYDENFNTVRLVLACATVYDTVITKDGYYGKGGIGDDNADIKYLRFSMLSYTTYPYTIHKKQKQEEEVTV